jgi:hypothetical protein
MANFEFLNGSSQGPHNHRFKRDREKEGKGVRRARQPVGKYNINKRQSDFSGQKFQWKKFWKKKIKALGSLDFF